MTLIIVTGMPGTGSSTVINEALKLQNESGAVESEFKPKNYGDVMFETAIEKGQVKNRDEMRKLSVEKQREIQMHACDKIAVWRESMDLIIDTHCTIKTPRGYFPGLPEYVLRKLNPDLLVLIEATPEEIFDRRQNDKTRKRDVEAKSGIEEHQFMNRAMSMAYSCLTGAAVKIIGNHDGELKTAADEFVKLLDV